MAEPSPDMQQKRVPFAALWPFLLITFGIAWGMMALFVLMPDQITATFGEISGSHPLFILTVYSPAIAALVVALYHFRLNNPLWPDAQPHDTLFFVAAVVLVVALNRKTLFAKTGAITAVIPERVP